MARRYKIYDTTVPTGRDLSLQQLFEETDFADEEVEQLITLEVNHSLAFGGGAAAEFYVRRSS